MPHTPESARIPQEELIRLKSSADLPALVQNSGVLLKKHGSKDLIGLCPFHNDTNPSLIVTPSKNLWHCLGTCQEGGDAINWIMKTQHLNFREAVEILRGETSTPTNTTGGSETTDQELLKKTIIYYHALPV